MTGSKFTDLVGGTSGKADAATEAEAEAVREGDKRASDRGREREAARDVTRLECLPLTAYQ